MSHLKWNELGKGQISAEDCVVLSAFLSASPASWHPVTSDGALHWGKALLDECGTFLSVKIKVTKPFSKQFSYTIFINYFNKTQSIKT